jgi:hypothetical protein
LRRRQVDVVPGELERFTVHRQSNEPLAFEEMVTGRILRLLPEKTIAGRMERECEDAPTAM